MSNEFKTTRGMERQSILKIAALAHDLSTSHRETNYDLPMAFVRISGHTGQIDIDLHENGWWPTGPDEESSVTGHYCIYFGSGFTEGKDGPEVLPVVIAEMERLAEKRARILSDRKHGTWEPGGGESVETPDLVAAQGTEV